MQCATLTNIDDFSICAGNFYFFGHSTSFWFPLSSRSLASGEGWAQELSSESTFYDESCTAFSAIFLVCSRFVLVTCFHLFCHDPANVLGDVDSVDRSPRKDRSRCTGVWKIRHGWGNREKTHQNIQSTGTSAGCCWSPKWIFKTLVQKKLTPNLSLIPGIPWFPINIHRI